MDNLKMLVISIHKNWPNDAHVEGSPSMDKDEHVDGLPIHGNGRNPNEWKQGCNCITCAFGLEGWHS